MATILVGNGINQLEGLAPNWSRLIEEVAGCFQVRESMDHTMSMTMGFEKFIIPLLEKGYSERQVKEKIRSIIQKSICEGSSAEGFRWDDTFHHKIMTLQGCHILTTNYDYCLERSLDLKFKPKQTTRAILYSKDRHQQVGEKRVWHIHGELRGPCSICLGYDRVNRGSGKRYQGDVYTCRKDETGRKLDRLAMEKCSKALGHNRVSVVAGHYLRGI